MNPRPSHHFGEADVLREQRAVERERELQRWEDEARDNGATGSNDTDGGPE